MKDNKLRFSENGIYYITVLGTALALFIMVLFTFRFSYANVRESKIEKGMAVAQNGTDKISLKFDVCLNTFNLTYRYINDMLSDSETYSDVETFIRKAAKANEGDESLLVGAYAVIDGNLVHGFEWEDNDDYNPLERDWYKFAMANPGTLYVSEPYVDEFNTGRNVVTLSKALDNGRGVFGIDIYLDSYSGTVRDVTVDGLGKCFIFDNAGYIIASYDQSTVGRNFFSAPEYDDQSVHNMINSIIEDGAGGYKKFYLYDRQTAVFSMKINDYWNLALTVPEKELFADAYKNMYAVIILSGIIVALVIYFIVRVWVERCREKKLSEETRIMSEDMREALRKAQNADEAKTRFLFNMSHDIRTPMNAMIGFTQKAIKNSDKKEIVDECLSKVSDSEEYLLCVLNDVLDMASMSEGKIDLEERTVCIYEHASNIAEMFEPVARGKGVKFKCDFEQVKDVYIRQDDLRMRQILVNVISNSIKYTKPSGEVTFTINSLEGLRPGYGRFEYVIKDTGIGMSDYFIEHIYDLFEKEDNLCNDKNISCGLGMSLVKRLVEMMNGVIKIESKIGEGTCVSITLDSMLDSKESMLPKNQMSLKDNSFSGMKVLVAEDNELNMELTCEILESLGVVVDRAEDGTVAVEKVRKSKAGDIDLILMDIQMPYMDGYRATREIRSIEGSDLRYVPIVAMTANAFAEDRKKAFSMGMDGHLAKPIEISKLIETLNYYRKR